MNRLRFRLILLSLVACVGQCLNGCSSPVAGATETGNPEVAVAALMAFDEVSRVNADTWAVGSWVPGGFEHLDSASIVDRYQSAAAPALAKRWIERSDTTVDGAIYIHDSLFIDDSIVRPDTSLIMDTVLVADTLISVRDACDTIRTIGSVTADTVLSVQCSQFTDSVLVIDTLVSVDTFFSVDTIVYRDTVVLYDTVTLADSATFTRSLTTDAAGSTAAANYQLLAGDQVVINTVPSRISMSLVDAVEDPYFDFSVPVTGLDTANFRVESSMLVSSVLREYAQSGGRVTERFVDRDGDGLLFSALTGSPLVRFSSVMQGSGSTVTDIDYDGGTDRSLATVGDINVTSLLQRSSFSGVNRIVRYGAPRSDESGVYNLSVENFFETDSLENSFVTYSLVTETGSPAGPRDKLTQIAKSMVYRSGSLSQVAITIRLFAPLEQGMVPDSAEISLEVLKADGSRGYMDKGILRNGVSPVLCGVYSRDGNGGYVQVDESGEVDNIDITITGPRIE